ncbi:agglutinin receptor precursor [mine drainage metagenome]|uniref:Agglutinin receptor n=1 Tax=mine drainage metagenome TaxID=410659 RepID=A0A1J5Q8S3_9ZZZZ
MTYLAHFGLTDPPFTLTPDVDRYFPSHEHANIVASVDFALRQDCGIIKIVGDVGTGKTLLCRLLIRQLHETDCVAYINAPQCNKDGIIRTICEEFGLRPAADGANPLTDLNRFLVAQHEAGKLCVVVVDEAQHLGPDGLEAVRLVSNLETEKKKLLQIVLFGQTELDDLLAAHNLRQLNQRIVYSLATKPLSPGETKRYLQHRLRVSRRPGVEYEIFSAQAVRKIVRYSGGIPRIINILADKSLLVAFSEGSPLVRGKDAAEAIADSHHLIHRPPFAALRRLALPVVAALALLAALAGLAYGGRLLWQAHKSHGAAGPALAASPAPTPTTPHPTAPPAAAPTPPPAPAPAPAAAPPAAAPTPPPAPAPAPAAAAPAQAPAPQPQAAPVAEATPSPPPQPQAAPAAPAPQTAAAPATPATPAPQHGSPPPPPPRKPPAAAVQATPRARPAAQAQLTPQTLPPLQAQPIPDQPDTPRGKTRLNDGDAARKAGAGVYPGGE